MAYFHGIRFLRGLRAKFCLWHKLNGFKTWKIQNVAGSSWTWVMAVPAPASEGVCGLRVRKLRKAGCPAGAPGRGPSVCRDQDRPVS